jgi:hypothetical protein
MTVTVVERSKAYTVFLSLGSRDRGFESDSGHECLMCVCAFFCVCVVLCLHKGFATSWSPIQGVLPSVSDQETEKLALWSKVGAWGRRRKNVFIYNPIEGQKNQFYI